MPYERPPHIRWQGRSIGDLALSLRLPDPYAQEVKFNTDAEGFRNSEHLEHADLIFIGDSFTEAGNVPEDETFVRRVAKMTGMSAPNLGRAGYSPGIRPKEPLVATLNSPSGDSHRIYFSTKPGFNQDPRQHSGWPYIESAIEKTSATLKESQIGLIVVFLPMKFRVFSDAIESNAKLSPDASLAIHLSEVCRRENVPFVDLTPSLKRRADAGDLVYPPMDVHLSSLGHEIAASLIADAILQLPNGQ